MRPDDHVRVLHMIEAIQTATEFVSGRQAADLETDRMLWSIFDHVRSDLQNRGMITGSYVFSRLALRLAETQRPPFGFIVVDEAQDVSISQLRFLAALAVKGPNHLFFAGDLG
jgi:superfamily I DNA/RNA helicase